MSNIDPATWQVVGTPNINGMPDVLWQDVNPNDSNFGKIEYWLLNRGSGGAISVASYGYITNPYNPDPRVWRIAGTADFNGDGSPDILWQSLDPSNGGVEVWYMNGVTYSGSFSTLSGAYTSADPRVWRLVGDPDANKDGHPDLLWQNLTNGQLVYWFANGSNGTNIYGATTLTITNSPYGFPSASQWPVVGVH